MRDDEEDDDSDYEGEKKKRAGGGGGGGAAAGSEEEDLDEMEEDFFKDKEFYEHLHEPQRDRFDSFSHAKIPWAYVRRVMTEVVNGPLPPSQQQQKHEDGGDEDEEEDDDEEAAPRGRGDRGAKIGRSVSIAMGGIAKVLVAELTEEARTVMTERGEQGPIKKEHLVEAHRRLTKRGTLAFQRPTTKLFSNW